MVNPRPSVYVVGPEAPPFGGIATVRERLTGHLDDRGVEVDPATTGTGSAGRFRWLARSYRYMRLAGRLRRAPPRLVHLLSSSGTSLVINVAVALLAQRGGHRVLLSLLGGRFGEEREPASCVQRWALGRLRDVDRIIASNPHIEERLLRLGVDPDRIERVDNLLPNPVPDGAGWEALPLPLKQAAPLLLASGAFEPEYDLETLLRGFAHSRPRLPGGRLGVLIAERGDPAYRAELLALKSTLSLDDAVFFLRDLPEVVSVLRRTAVFVRSTRVDGDAVSVWEALLEGVPVVASNTGTRPRQCLLFPIGDSQALADALVSASVDEAGRRDTDAVVTRARNNLERIFEVYRSMGVEV